MSKKLILFLAAIAVLALAGLANAIVINNPGFEDPAYADGDYGDTAAWTGGYYDLTDPGVWVAYAGDAGGYNPEAVAHGYGGFAPEGENVAWTTSYVGYDGGLSQVLSATLQANTQYDLSALVGNPVEYNWGPTGDYRIELLAGGVVLASDTGPSPLDDTTWTTASLTFNPGASHAQLGQALEIRLLAVDFDDTYEVDFDNVTLSYLEVVHAAVYLWNGSAADGLWETPANWTVIDSAWTWPNEENTADPNMAKFTNADTLGIYIFNGDAVTRTGWLAIQGALDGSTTAVLTLNNGSSLTVDGRLATSTSPNMMGRGQIDILGGSTLTIIGSDNDIRIADDNGNWGTLNIVDSTVNIADDLHTDQGEGHITISGSSILNADDIVIADPNDSVGYLDISGTSLVTVVDDLRIDQGVGYITISGDAIVSVGDEIYVGDGVTGLGYLDISGNAIIVDVDDLRTDDGEGHITISGNASFRCDDIQIANKTTGVGTLDISGNAWVYVNDDLSAGEDGIGTVNISGDAIVIVRDLLYVAHDAGEGTLNISDNATVYALDDLIVANAGGVTATLNISGNPTINVKDDLYMNDDSGDPSNSKIVMDGGRVTVGDQTTFNDDNNGTAEFIMNGGSFYSDDDIFVSDNLDGTAHLTINGGSMITGDNLKLGDGGGEDIGQARIFINGGLLQAEGLDIAITDSQIVYSGGEFRIAEVNEAEMQQLITDGTIVTTGAYSIATDGNYTVLSSLSPEAAKFPSPADGASDVLIGTTLSWTQGDTAATHDVYFGTTNPPALVGNQAEASYYPGLLQPGTTYYWQIDEVEADGTTKHAGSVNSFTTGISNVAMQIRIKASSDDVEGDIAGGNNPSSGDLEFPYDGDPKPEEIQVIGLRFADVGLAKGTTITSAAVQFDEDDVDDSRHIDNVHIIIEGQLNPNPDTFADVNDSVLDRQPRTTAMVEWDPPVWAAEHVRGPEARTSDVSSIIQELIDQDGWAIGNSIVLILSDNPDNPSVGMREAESFDGAGGNASQRPTLHVTAISDAATGPNPANGATDVPIDTLLSWWPGIGAVSHDGYIGTTSPPPFLGNTPEVSFDAAGLLEPSTIYYWQVDAVDADGTTHTGPIWSFTTEPGEATQPDPADNAVGVALDATLSWTPGVTAATHDVYLGTSSPPAFIGNQAESSFDPGLEFGTTYYWQINEIEADGTTTYTGDIWSFTTVLDIPITDPNLLGWWTLDEGAGITAVDYSGHDHYGTVNGATWMVDGHTGGALDFDGDDYVDFGNPSLLNFGTGSWSISAWIKMPASTDQMIIFGKGGDSAGGIRYMLSMGETDDHKACLTLDDNSTKVQSTSSVTVDDGQWHHIVGLRDGGNIRIYVDGAQDGAAVALPDGYDLSGTSQANAYIGTGWNYETSVLQKYFIGMIDEVRIYNIALSEAEIQVLAAPPRAWSPDPADGAIEVAKTPTLSWLAGATAATHDVYFSADQQAVIDGTALIGNQAETSYSPADLAKGTTYYWRVDEVEADGTTHTGAVWSFTVTTLGR